MIPRLAAYPMPDPATFPTSPVSWTTQAGRSVLLVHDLQSYFLNFYDVTQPPVPALLVHVQALLDRCRALGIPVVYTAQPGDQNPADRALLTDFWGTGLKDDPAQTQVDPAVAPQPGDTVLAKWRYSAFKRTPLQDLMADWGRDQLLICGIYANIGCLMTAAEAFMLDIQPFLVGDALADFSEAEHRQALAYSAARCAQVTSTAQVLGALTAAVQPAAQTDHWTPAAVRAAVAAQLEVTPDELHEDDDLLLLGLDSIRLMMLVEGWQAAGGQIAYADVAAEPTLRAITERLCAPELV
ncbi:isochorismatase family protein [Deinococcus sp. HMF7620]|uniref:isochorismatase n=1 Tax=Deinococcus arboris TaxID=2682977 RepID=A0A7C9LN65_9DEIO|nr:isochorismatase family protein [Deinococcus arboris]MVN88738.1 isochorismatase family protein [Deinococcus arboris]